MNKIQELLAVNMKKARQTLGYSQMKLAEICNLSTSFIAEIETGIRHNDGVIYKNNHNSFFIWVVCTEEKRIKLFQQFLTNVNGNRQFIEEEYVLIVKPETIDY